METWFIVIISLCASALLKFLFDNLFSSASSTANLPPGPPKASIIERLRWLRKPFQEIEQTMRDLKAKYGPIFILHIGPRPSVIISDRFLAHRALIQNGAAFADRPRASAPTKVFSSNQHNISSAAYGPNWRLFRRNLTSEILHPARVKFYALARKWVLDILLNRLESWSDKESGVKIMSEFQYAMFCLLVYMCFGDKVEEKQIQEIERVQRDLLMGITRFNILVFWPKVGKVIFRKKWEQLYSIRKNQEEVLVPLIKARKDRKFDEVNDQFVLSYVDTLHDLELPEEKRKLNEGEIVSLCSEFLNAGTDTTSTALQWIMANLVKYPHIQDKLVEEIEGIVGKDCSEVKEEDLSEMKYLEAVILEGLRRHPPAHFVLPHRVTEDVKLDGHLVPKNAAVNFMVAEIGWDPKVWESPMDFKPERFLSANGEVFDITGSREIKMMPFGAGRRICPGYGLSLLHLQYFVANLVWRFHWTAVAGDDVDLSEQQEFSVVMKNPLNARVSRR